MRTPILGGNWKMNLTLGEAERLASLLRARLGSHRACELVVFPPHPYLGPVGQRLRGSALMLGAQDLAAERGGAYTGGVSGAMLRSVGCDFALVGHSERRAHYQEHDAQVRSKLEAALAAGLGVVLCVGESEAQRRAEQTFEVLARQLGSALNGLAPRDLEGAGAGRFVLAYEPVWAIGTGVSATPGQAEEAHAFLRGWVKERLGEAFAQALRIQYGGSVNAKNAADFLRSPEVDGLLVGGASLDGLSFTQIAMAGGLRPLGGPLGGPPGHRRWEVRR